MRLDTEVKFQLFFLLLAAVFASIPLALVPFIGGLICQWGILRRIRPGTVGLLINFTGFFIFAAFWIMGFSTLLTLIFVAPVICFITSFRYTLKKKEFERVFD